MVIGLMHRHKANANQGQHSKQHQFGGIVDETVENIRIYWTTRDHRTPVPSPLLRLSVRVLSALKLPLVNIVQIDSAGGFLAGVSIAGSYGAGPLGFLAVPGGAWVTDGWPQCGR